MGTTIPHKIRAAEATTDVVQEAVGKALTVLNHGFNGRILNGWGIYTDPSQRRRDLMAARELIEGAIACMATTNWPTRSDYEAAQ